MTWLTDTSILVRTIQTGSSVQQTAINALAELRIRGEILCVVPQNIIEFWAVATRPVTANGLGFSIEETSDQIEQIRLHFVLKNDEEPIFENWRNLVRDYRVSGKPTHDARIVGAMQTHRIENLLTFNVADFNRYADIITVSAPEDII